MTTTETAEQLRLMRTRAVLCYNTSPSGPVYSIHATVPGLGVLSGAADLIEAQAAQIAELQEAVAAEREACALAAEGYREGRDDRAWIPGSLYDTLRRDVAAVIRTRSAI